MRTSKIFQITDPKRFKKQLFAWNKQFYTSVWLESNNYEQRYSSFDVCLAAEDFFSIKTDFEGAFEELKEYYSRIKDYLFGYIAYDVKNDTEKLTSKNHDALNFDDLYFFQPKKIIFIKGNIIEFEYLKMVDDEIDLDFEQIQKIKYKETEKSKNTINMIPRISREQYLQKIEKVIAHIQQGDIYEANFCQEFYAENTEINPYKIYTELNAISETPFATFMRLEDHYVMSATPERYIRKESQKIISQPIKGTAKRFENQKEDEISASNLVNDEKERAENIMIVDLVRNDLSKTAKKGTVKVEELCEINSFKQVHQLISTVTSEVEHTTHPVDVVRDTFPMGSMTGAPKISAMKIMEALEETKRGLYSGTIGYFMPNGDFDFNVIIRTILYNFEKKYVSYTVGGAITAKSIPEKEYEECLLKAEAMRKVLMKN